MKGPLPMQAKKHTFAFLLMAFLMPWSGARAQEQEKALPSMPDVTTLRSEINQQTKVPEMRASVPLDAPVNAQEYVVGPGDVLGLNVWGTSPIERQLTVTPEGTLLIPGVGSVDVTNETLQKVKEKVVRRASQKYLRSEITVTLLTPRKISVQIAGYVIDEGKKNVYAVQRVDDLIAMSNAFPSDRLTVTEYAQQLTRLRSATSDRHIMVRSRDGSMRNIDLVKYRITGNGKYNPYLCEGDNVYVPERTDEDNTIAVFGARVASANFEFVPGDSLSGLISMGLGFADAGDPEHAFLSRLSPDGRRMDTLHVDARAIAEGSGKDIALRPGDRLVIPRQPEMRQNYRVRVEGAVARPGTYPITLANTRLSEAIRNAGGILKGANLKGATLLRFRLEAHPDQEAMSNEQLLSKRTSLSVEDSSYYLAETALRLKREEVSVDFYKLFVQGDSSQDVVLRSNDQIQIPGYGGTVYVFGQVVNPGHVEFVAGEDYRYYVEKAGGYTNDARSSDAKIIKAKGQVWLDPGETSLEDGDLLWVPKDLQYPASHYIATWAQVFGIIGVVATVALLVKTL